MGSIKEADSGPVITAIFDLHGSYCTGRHETLFNGINENCLNYSNG